MAGFQPKRKKNEGNLEEIMQDNKNVAHNQLFSKKVVYVQHLLV